MKTDERTSSVPFLLRFGRLLHREEGEQVDNAAGRGPEPSSLSSVKSLITRVGRETTDEE
jgi:hypothetical protein